MSSYPEKPPRLWLRISIRAMMLLVLIVAVLIGWRVNRANTQRSAVAAIRKAKGFVGYDYQYDHSPHGDVNRLASPWAPAWLRGYLGDEFFQDVAVVKLKGPLTEATRKALEGLDRLEYFGLTSSAPIGDALKHLRCQDRMESVNLRGPGITDESLAPLRGMTRIKNLGLQDTKVTDAGLAHLAGLSEIQRFQILQFAKTDPPGEVITEWHRIIPPDESLVTDKGLAHLSGFHKLQELRLTHAPGVTDLCTLDPRRNMPELKILDLRGTGISDEGLAPLAGCSRIEALYLDHTRINGNGLSHLRGLESLTMLQLIGTDVNDDGLAYLGVLPKIRSLNLAKTKVTDSGMKHLYGLQNLKWLSVIGTEVSAFEVGRLKVAVPGLD